MKKTIRTIVIIIVAALVLGAIIGIIFGLFKKAQAPTEEPSGSEEGYQPGGLPPVSGGVYKGGAGETTGVSGSIEEYYETQKQRLFALTSGPVIDYWVASTTEGEAQNPVLRARVFYLNEKGEVFEVKDKSNEELIVSSDFGIPIYAIQNSDGSRAIVKFDTEKFAMFGLSAKAWTFLGDLISAAFSPDGKKIAYIQETNGISSLYIRDVSSAKQTLTLVSKLHINDFNIEWPSSGRIFLVPKNSHDFLGEIWSINLNNKTIGLFASGKSISIVFSKLVDRAIKFVSAGRDSMSASVTDFSNKNIFGVDLWTVSDKCSFSYDNKNALFCSSPYANNKEFSITLPDDYLKKSIYFKDRIMQFDLSNSSNKTILDIPDFEFDAVKIKHVNDNLFFHNRLDGKVYLYDTKA